MVDLVRTRRRGVPRYNDFRAGLHKPRIKRWEDLTADPETVAGCASVYRSIDEVDTMVGLFAETPPDGFGFSDTAFRIFILMASRRLQSDRFLTVDFRPEIYSPFGMDWIAQQRHDQRDPAPLPRAGRGAAARRQRLRPVACRCRSVGHDRRRCASPGRPLAGLAALLQRPLLERSVRRRTHRVSRGSSVSRRLDELRVDASRARR